MEKLEEKIKAIIIPSGDDAQDLIRAKTAMEFYKKNNLPKKCVVAGFGPDMNIALGCEENKGKENLDFHENLYNYLINETDWTIGVDAFSMNSIENILNVFPEGTSGKYALVSYPTHLNRFKKIVRDAKKSGKISRDVEVVYVPTKQNMKETFYETLSTIKYHLVGKKKYFSK